MFADFTAEKAVRWLKNGSGAIIVTAVLGAVLAINLSAVNALMDTDISTDIQYVIATVCVVIEAFGLVLMRSAWSDRRWGAAIVFAVATAIAFVNSCGNEATFYNLNFSNKAHRLSNDVVVAGDAAKEKSEIEARLAKAENLRPVAEVENAITAALARPIKGDRNARTLGSMTKDCTATKSSYYDQCQTVLTLRTELANAVAVTPTIEKDKARLETLRNSQAWITSVGVVNPGADLISKVTNSVIDWRGGSENDHVSPELVQAFYIAALVLATQFFHLFLPFAFFGRSTKRAAIETGMTKLRDFDLTATPVVPVDEIVLAVPSPIPVAPVDAPVLVDANTNDTASSSTPIAIPSTALTTIESNAANANDVSVDEDDLVDEDDCKNPSERAERLRLRAAKKAKLQEFIRDCCDFDSGSEELSMYLHTALTRYVGDEALTYSVKHITKAIRELPGCADLKETGKNGNDRARNHRKIVGIKLNSEGRRLAGLPPSKLTGLPAKDRRAAI